jgi:hypothetical protein
MTPVNKTLANGEKPKAPLDEGGVIRNYLAYSFTRWPNGRIPYTLGKEKAQNGFVPVTISDP